MTDTTIYRAVWGGEDHATYTESLYAPWTAFRCWPSHHVGAWWGIPRPHVRLNDELLYEHPPFDGNLAKWLQTVDERMGPELEDLDDGAIIAPNIESFGPNMGVMGKGITADTPAPVAAGYRRFNMHGMAYISACFTQLLQMGLRQRKRLRTTLPGVPWFFDRDNQLKQVCQSVDYLSPYMYFDAAQIGFSSRVLRKTIRKRILSARKFGLPQQRVMLWIMPHTARQRLDWEHAIPGHVVEDTLVVVRDTPGVDLVIWDSIEAYPSRRKVHQRWISEIFEPIAAKVLDPR